MINRFDYNLLCILGCGLDVEWIKEILLLDFIFFLEFKEVEWFDLLFVYGYYFEMFE